MLQAKAHHQLRLANDNILDRKLGNPPVFVLDLHRHIVRGQDRLCDLEDLRERAGLKAVSVIDWRA